METEGYNVKGDEQTRRELSILLIKWMGGLIGITLLMSFTLMWAGKLESDKAITFILAVATIFSGLLGSAITYYFSSK